MRSEPAEISIFTIERMGVSTRHAASGDYTGELAADVDESDVLRPVGSAKRQPDGSYRVQLSCLPLDGVLVMRLPTGG